MKNLALIFGALLAWLCFAPCTWSQSFYTLLTNGPTAKRINIVFLAEGYISGQDAQFTNNAVAALNQLLNTRPFSDYRGYYNAFGIFVASVETGSDHPSRSVFRNTYFNSTYDSYGITRLITIPPNDRDATYANGQGKVDALLQNFLPEYDLAFMVVNDTEYGGSGGRIAITSVNSSSALVGVHETGHSYGGLADEYEYGGTYPVYDGDPNTTGETNRTLIKWHAWIADSTPVPTPETSTYGSVVGLFEGARYYPTGWFRPKLDCYMRTLGVPFCEVCAEALIKSTYGYLRPIEAISPATNSVLGLTNTEQLVLSVTPLCPTPFSLAIQWFTNNTALPGATNTTLILPGALLPEGTNQVRVVVHDPTTKVRNDPAQLLQDSRTWTISVREPPPPRFQNFGRLPDGSCSMEIAGALNQRCRLEFSTNLAQWQELITLSNLTGTISFTDSAATNSVQRFYRAVQGP